ncbi:MAG TPA: hypothetical protein VN844_07875 [Pyrinomonadaceae bacterium]|nr:hypothetical protein [Pyrinomonadaceae bacterium]
MTASTRENDYSNVKKIVALLIAFIPVLNQPAVGAQQRQDLVRITGETTSVRQCIQQLDENRQEEQAELHFRLSITNLSNRPLIIYRYAPAPFDVRLSRTLAGIPHGKFHYGQRPAFSHPPRDFAPAELATLFRVLPPNSSLTYEDPQSLKMSSTELIEANTNLLEGQSYIQLKLATWVWEIEKAEKLQQLWARYGDFFYQDVTTEPFPFTINKPGAATPRCDTLSIK